MLDVSAWPSIIKLTSIVAVIDGLALLLDADSRGVSTLLVPPYPDASVLLLHELLETVE